MTYKNLSSVVVDLEKQGHLVRIDTPVDPHFELGVIQRRAFAKKSPAMLFTQVKGTSFPMLANLFGTMDRVRYLFRSSLHSVEALFAAKADPFTVFRRPLTYARLPFALLNALPQKRNSGPATRCTTRLSSLPQLLSWPDDGGAFITLPQVYTESPAAPGLFHSNMGMYRVQISGGEYEKDSEAGLHYQLHRGIGPHHAEALARGEDLRVVISVGGPPSLALASVFPLPMNIPELCLAGILGGHRIPMIAKSSQLPIPAESDFAIVGRICGKRTAPEGPFGDHLGYYSLRHDFPVLSVDRVYHRPDAIWPFTTVGRPPQEDTVFGEFIHELTGALIPSVFPGVNEVHAVDAAGVHPLLLAVGRERYVPFSEDRKPQEIITSGLHLLGTTQTSLAKYLLIVAGEDNPALSCKDIPAFFSHLLARTDFERDLHFITKTTQDTLDYTGLGFNQGSKLLWTVAGEKKQELNKEIPGSFALLPDFFKPLLFVPGVLLCGAPAHTLPEDCEDPLINALTFSLEQQLRELEGIALIVIVDDPVFCSASWSNFLWATFTRSDPATDVYGIRSGSNCKHWGCKGPLVIDARLKSYQAPPLMMDEAIERKVDALGVKGGPLYGLI